MSDLADLLKESSRHPRASVDAQALVRRGRTRARRARYVAAIGTAVLVVVSGAALMTIRTDEHSRILFEPPTATTPLRPGGIFADIDGWLAFGDDRGIWAVDPTRPGDSTDLVQLSSTPGSPRAWSADGSKLLVFRRDSDKTGIFVLDADGTETHLTDAAGYVTGGSFSPDGSKVVYAANGDRSISVIDASGGTPRILHTAQAVAGACCIYGATFSPDGTQIAYFEGMGDHSNSLRVMNADGSGSRSVIERQFGHFFGLQWSPDGTRLVFATRDGGILVVGADGTGLVEVSPEAADGADPHWSPDGSLLSYNTGDWSGEIDALLITRPNGTRVRRLDDGRSGPWNP